MTKALKKCICFLVFINGIEVIECKKIKEFKCSLAEKEIILTCQVDCYKFTQMKSLQIMKRKENDTLFHFLSHRNMNLDQCNSHNGRINVTERVDHTRSLSDVKIKVCIFGDDARILGCSNAVICPEVNEVIESKYITELKCSLEEKEIILACHVDCSKFTQMKSLQIMKLKEDNPQSHLLSHTNMNFDDCNSRNGRIDVTEREDDTRSAVKIEVCIYGETTQVLGCSDAVICRTKVNDSTGPYEKKYLWCLLLLIFALIPFIWFMRRRKRKQRHVQRNRVGQNLSENVSEVEKQKQLKVLLDDDKDAGTFPLEEDTKFEEVVVDALDQDEEKSQEAVEKNENTVQEA